MEPFSRQRDRSAIYRDFNNDPPPPYSELPIDPTPFQDTRPKLSHSIIHRNQPDTWSPGSSYSSALEGDPIPNAILTAPFPPSLLSEQDFSNFSTRMKHICARALQKRQLPMLDYVKTLGFAGLVMCTVVGGGVWVVTRLMQA